MKEIALHILDIVQNSIAAGSSNIGIGINESLKGNHLRIIISDDGCGISEGILATVDDPWTTSRTVRRVGMGIPLFKQSAESAGGSLEISSIEGKGTEILAEYRLDHIDRQPMGDLTGILKILIGTEDGIDFSLKYITDFGNYEFSTRMAREILEVQDFREQSLLNQIREMIRENLQSIKADIL